MRDLDAFMDRALEDRLGEPDPVPVLEPVAVPPVPRVERPSLEARRKQLRHLLDRVVTRGGVCGLSDFWSPGSRHEVWPWEDPVREEAVGLMLDDRLAPDWAKAFGVPVERFRRWREVTVEPHQWLGVDVGYPMQMRCTGTTRAGTQCKNRVPLGWRVAKHPGDLRPGITDRCRLHKERGDVPPSVPSDAAS